MSGIICPLCKGGKHVTIKCPVCKAKGTIDTPNAAPGGGTIDKTKVSEHVSISMQTVKRD